MMAIASSWITGGTRSGKTTRLVDRLQDWIDRLPAYTTPDRLPQRLQTPQTATAILILAANGDNRIALGDRIDTALHGEYPLRMTTPLGLFLDDTILFWPLLVQQLNLRAQFPLRLRPETEQELASKLWQPQLIAGTLYQDGINSDRLVRRILDLLQLAGAAGFPAEDVSTLLDAGLGASAPLPAIGEALVQWRDWCLERGFLTYGIIFELYWRYLLPHPTYQQHLTTRYRAVCADDVDEYPAICRSLFEVFLDAHIPCAFTYNPNGGVRLGLNADPQSLAQLAQRCQIEALSQRGGLGESLANTAVQLVLDPLYFQTLPPQVQSIQTGSRAQLLRQTAEIVIAAVTAGEVEPQDIAIIAPGLDTIARYSFSEILSRQGIPTYSLNLQRPLASSPQIRALLTLLALVYPSLGRSIDRDAIAEMLVVLSVGKDDTDRYAPAIDPVRAGLIADRCYVPDPDRPTLLPATEFARWDRLGYLATATYDRLCQWIEQIRLQLEQRLIPSPVSFLDRAIERFLWRVDLPPDRLAPLRELLETAQHYWEVANRTQTDEPTTLANFIQLLRRGTVTANPYPVRPIQPAVTLANIYQYRTSRLSHRWQFWLDAGSPLWASGGAAVLFAAPLFLQDRAGKPWTADDEIQADDERLQRILLDLFGRADDRVFLCHSDLAVNGQDRLGPLLSLVNASVLYVPGLLV